MSILRRMAVSLATDIVDVTAYVAKLLFIVGAPLLLIACVALFMADCSFRGPLAFLALVCGVFVATQWLHVKMQSHREGEARGVALHWPVEEDEKGEDVPSLESEADVLQKEKALEAVRRRKKHQAEDWERANPWGGFNPYE